jgi:DNA-binding LacI/PurR family transcriptional regulator
MSLNEASAQFNIAKDTVQRAYQKLREKGIIEPVRSKGFFIKSSYVDAPLRVLLIFNKITAYKKTIFNSFANALSTKAVVDLQVHYYDEAMFEKIIDSSKGQYNYYVIMPFFFEYNDRFRSVFTKIPPGKLLLLNKKPAFLSDYRAVYEDFENDIYQVLKDHTSDIVKFDRLTLVFPEDPMSNYEIKTGFIKYCTEQKLNYTIETGTVNLNLKARNLYIIIDDDDLAEVIKKCRLKMMEIGRDIGLISYNDTVLKEVLENGITVISTDFEQMGESAAEMILEGRSESIKNPFRMIRRSSF